MPLSRSASPPRSIRKAYFIAKTLEMRQRHTKFENTPYSLEPNCKESPGGLRDLQVILWVAKAAGLGKSWDDLARKGLATAFEARQIKRNEELLSLIRARLHVIANRREDRLVFDLQTAVAESFGYPTQVHPGGRVIARASEALMKRFYWAAKAVTQLNQILLLNIEERLNPTEHEPQPINERFSIKAGMIEVASDDLYLKHPQAILETFLVYQTTVGAEGLSARTLRALYNARKVMDSEFRNDPANHATFRAMLMAPRGITHAMRLMNQTSVLGRYLWAFRRIVGQMQHDLFHVYTVDQHILMVLRNVRRFFIAEHAHEYPFCSQLAAGWDKPYILYVAALFHDIAKGRGGDHSELGARDVRLFCRQHGIDPRGLQADRVPGQGTPGHEPDRAEAGPERPRRHRRFRPARGQRALPHGAVPAHGGRHPRHQPQGVECLERQAAGRPLPAHAAHAGRARPRPGRRSRGAQARGPGAAGAVRAALRGPQEAVGHAGRGLLHAPRRRRHRLAYATGSSAASRRSRAANSPMGDATNGPDSTATCSGCRRT